MTVSTGPTGPTGPAELLARIPDFEQALAYYRRHLAPDTVIDLSVAENVLVYEDSMQKMVFDHTALLPETYIHYMSAYARSSRRVIRPRRSCRGSPTSRPNSVSP
ncbi:hypothetical protein [Kitasatospora sp. MBT66]|uniref:hypothetical protein n=1 Tax=Kitasatospora sp. MBT66 TaxID=1444769 RepID=UPI0005BDD294|nr:hypothetical protein [Kitasatospora sp. MBT66]